MDRADEIGISIGTGLSRVRHRSDNYVDNKSKPKDDMPSWWISSNWIPPESEDEDDEDDEDDSENDNDPENVNDTVNDKGDDNEDKDKNNDDVAAIIEVI